MTSIMLITLYNDPLPCPQSQYDGWAAHYDGVLSYTKARGSAMIELSSPSHRLLFTNLRVPSIFIGLAKREKTITGEDDWLATVQQYRMQNRPRAVFYDMISSIPPLLEKTEILIDGEFREKDTVSLCGEIVKMKADLHKWLNRSSSAAGEFLRELEQSVVHISDQEMFNHDVEEHLVMSTNVTFHSFYNLRGEQRNEELSMYWMMCLILDCAILRILHWRPEMSKHISDHVRTGLENDGLSHAKSLCRKMNKMSQSESRGDTAYLQLLVAMPKNYFEEIGAFQQAGWCQAVAIASDMRLQRLTRSQPRTLRRMADLVSDIASLACFKARGERTVMLGHGQSQSPSHSAARCPFEHG